MKEKNDRKRFFLLTKAKKYKNNGPPLKWIQISLQINFHMENFFCFQNF